MKAARRARLLRGWPDWSRSIADARRHLGGYDPGWRPSTLPAEPGTPFETWRQDLAIYYTGQPRWPRYGRHFRQWAAWRNELLAKRFGSLKRSSRPRRTAIPYGFDEVAYAALDDLRLPSRYADFWKACLLSDRGEGASVVVPEEEHDMIHGYATRWVTVEPPEGFLEVDIVGGADRHDALQIEGPPALVTRATLAEASGRALAIVAGLRSHWPVAKVVAERSSPTGATEARQAASVARNRDVLRRLAGGATVYRVARDIGISERTVRRIRKDGQTAQISGTPG